MALGGFFELQFTVGEGVAIDEMGDELIAVETTPVPFGLGCQFEDHGQSRDVSHRLWSGACDGGPWRRSIRSGWSFVGAPNGKPGNRRRQTSRRGPGADTRRPWDICRGEGFLRLLPWLLSRLISTAHWVPMALYTPHDWELHLGLVLLAGLIFLILKANARIALWAFWVLVYLMPFALLPEDFVHHTVGTSRYLYGASAGSSILLALGLRHLCLRAGKFCQPL